MKTREEYTKTYLDDLENFVKIVDNECKEAGYKTINEAYETILNKPSLCHEITDNYNGYNSEEDYALINLIEGIYEYEKPLFKAHCRYDRILEKLVISGKIVANRRI
ncbi:hypothetical protein [Methanosarcina mazei]|uniref:Uncharacterized protein n=1 Tax=Methanosarcina mazei TaxID=2209 RepID=A0A0F8ND02_METMZ|nr:hypothetical protein [Methanosarcina mazei]KKH15666.1 hypothetical protein DU44_11285 [Methanosarcina mazei]KKH17923.1 hypothetical protein DU48_19275 [Methanosarcina mazei]KKH21135.1 hypothetical protein DU65_02850 [Methanosarcina mazei]KKH57103.1 hypothetical protein DU74_02140 [Methanosarcina mazei]